MQSKSLLCVVYDELVLTHEYARERVGNTYHRGNTYPRGGTDITANSSGGKHISEGVAGDICSGEQKIRGNTYLRYTGHKSVCQSVLYEVSHFLFSCVAVCDNITVVPAGCALPG